MAKDKDNGSGSTRENLRIIGKDDEEELKLVTVQITEHAYNSSIQSMFNLLQVAPQAAVMSDALGIGAMCIQAAVHLSTGNIREYTQMMGAVTSTVSALSSKITVKNK